MANHIDVFTNVHKGIRRALFEACLALGRANPDDAAARARLLEVLHFVAQHGDNEDALLLPMLEEKAPGVAQRMREGHAAVDASLTALQEAARGATDHTLYLQATAFVARYLAHMEEEEHVFEPLIRAALSPEDLAANNRRSVERTPPADRPMMIGWMLPAMSRAEVEAFLQPFPPEVAAKLRGLAAA